MQHPSKPECKLIGAVLARAVKDLFEDDKHISEHAKRFFDDTSDVPFSINWICHWLDLDRNELVRNLMHLRNTTDKKGFKELTYIG